MGFSVEVGSNNMTALRLITDEFNRAQNALREEMKEIATQMNMLATKAEAAVKYEPAPQKSGMRIWQCSAPT